MFIDCNKFYFFKNAFLLYMIVASTFVCSIAQNTNTFLNEQSRIIEDFIENIEGGEEFDFNTLFEDLEIFFAQPLNLNEAQIEDLEELKILNNIQIAQILDYRDRLGPFISIHELQAIPSLDMRLIRLLAQIIDVEESTRDYHLGLGEMLSRSDHVLWAKWRRVLEEQKGYIENAEGETPYIGDQNRFYLRYNGGFENKLKYGITAEKDAGEAFFKDNNKSGFDFYSAHIHLRDYSSLIKDVVLGDYSVSFGQGLILQNSFGGSKSSQVMNIKRGGRTLKRYNSINEINFFRGAAMTLNLTDHLESTIFASRKKIDANLSQQIDIDVEGASFSSIVEDGFHRTTREIEKENSIAQNSIGFNFKYQCSALKVGLNALYEKFDQPLQRRLQLYNQFEFSSDALTNVSLDYSYRYRNISAFGEIARSDNGGMAYLNGLLIGLDKSLDISVLYRDYHADYQNLQSNSFGESTGARNEQGIYLGMILRPAQNWKLSGYADFWKHPWLRFRRDAPSIGSEYLLRVDYSQRKKMSAYVQIRVEQKQVNESNDANQIDRLNTITLKRLRFHFNQFLGDGLELRNRVEFSFFENLQKQSNGFLIYQDVLYRPAGSKFSGSMRFSIFDTDDFDTRIYTYENDLIHEFFIPAYQQKGKRFYINLRYNVNRHITSEFRFSQTKWDNLDVISSGNERIDGNTKSEIKAQVKYKF